MDNKAKPSIGDKVRVFDINGARNGQPADGWPGTVVGVGRKFVKINYNHRTDEFWPETGKSHDDYEHQSFMLEQEAVDAGVRRQRRQAAWRTLQGVGIERNHAMPEPAVELLEAMAEAVKAWSRQRTTT